MADYLALGAVPQMTKGEQLAVAATTRAFLQRLRDFNVWPGADGAAFDRVDQLLFALICENDPSVPAQGETG